MQKKKELETLIQTVRIYSQDIGKEFSIEEYAMRVIKRGKRHITKGAEQPNQVVIRTLGVKETYIYLGVLEADTIKQVDTKEKIKKEPLRKYRKLLDSKLHSRNLGQAINTWAIQLVRYRGPLLKFIREELKQIDREQAN